jgi:hypothetical protein
MEQKNFEILTEKIVHDKGKCYIKEFQGVFKVVNLFSQRVASEQRFRSKEEEVALCRLFEKI